MKSKDVQHAPHKRARDSGSALLEELNRANSVPHPQHRSGNKICATACIAETMLEKA